jgi:hypothetical protein
MQVNESTFSFCKSSKKMINQWVIMLLMLIGFFSIEYFFTDDSIAYIDFLYQGLFDPNLLFLLAILLVFEYFEKDCVQYGKNFFQIERGIFDSEVQSFQFNDIKKINYMPYLRLYTITMKQENTYIDFNQGFYPNQKFQEFIMALETHQPISRGFYMPSGGIRTPLFYAFALVVAGFVLLLIAIGYIIK